MVRDMMSVAINQ